MKLIKYCTYSKNMLYKLYVDYSHLNLGFEEYFCSDFLCQGFKLDFFVV